MRFLGLIQERENWREEKEREERGERVRFFSDPRERTIWERERDRQAWWFGRRGERKRMEVGVERENERFLIFLILK